MKGRVVFSQIASRILTIIACMTICSLGKADVMSPVQDVTFEVKNDGAQYRYVMIEHGVEKWQSSPHQKTGKLLSGSVSPEEVADDLSLGVATGEVMLKFNGEKYYIGDFRDDTRKPLAQVTEDDLNLIYGAKARQSPLRKIVSKYRTQIDQLRGELSKCKPSSAVGKAGSSGGSH